MRTLVLLTACVGCSSPSTPPPGGVLDAAAEVDAPSPATPGVFATITGGDHAGTYALTDTVECNIDIETHAYRIFGGTTAIDLSLHTRLQPAAGQQVASPDFWVIVFAGTATFYPQDTGGSCSATIDASWPAARLRFSCTGGPFTITGTGICPPV